MYIPKFKMSSQRHHVDRAMAKESHEQIVHSFIQLVYWSFIAHMHFENAMYVYMFSELQKATKKVPNLRSKVVKQVVPPSPPPFEAPYKNVNGGEPHISHEQLRDLCRGRRPYDKAGPETRGLQ
jgi:hypothetical protein